MNRPSPHKIFYSPSKKSLHNKYKNIPSSSSSSKRNTIIKNNNNLLTAEEIAIKKGNETINKIDDTLLFLKSKKFSDDSLKSNVNNTTSFSSIFVDKLKKNQKLKEKNIYLKNVLKELKKINNSNYSNHKNSVKKNLFMNHNNNNSYYYNQLKKEFSELKYYNKLLKEEYSILKLEENNSANIKKIFTNKEEVISKIKSLNYSLNNFLDLISPSTEQKEKNKMNNNLVSSSSKQKPLKIHNHNRLPNSNKEQKLFFESKNLRKNASELIGNNAHKNRNLFYNNNHLRFTDEENLNTNYDNEHSEEFQITIPLKNFEKTITSQFKSNKKLGSINSDIKNEKKLTISESNKIICSFAKSLEYNNKKNGKEIKEFHTEKNKFPSKTKNSNFINGFLMNKSAKLFHLKQNANCTNTRQNRNVMKSKEKNLKNKGYNFKQNTIVSKKISKIFKKPIK